MCALPLFAGLCCRFEHLEKQSELLGQIKRDYQALYIRKEYLENELETLRSDLDGKNLQLLESDQQQTSLTVVLQDRLQLLNDLLLVSEAGATTRHLRCFSESRIRKTSSAHC